MPQTFESQTVGSQPPAIKSRLGAILRATSGNFLEQFDFFLFGFYASYIAKGRLVVPFKITLPADAGFYLVSPEATADTPKLSAFRQWLKASVQNKA